MNEGLSTSDRYASEFDASSTFFRGFDEELHLGRNSISRAELFEPFLEYNNFEIGIAGAAYTNLDTDRIIEEAAIASDRLLETDGFLAIPATTSNLTSFANSERDNMTNLLAFCLRSALVRNIGAT